MTDLSRRDRLAIALALDLLRSRRGDRAWDATEALDCGGPVSRAVWLAVPDDMGAAMGERLLRARLALLLRVLLRADAGDFGEVTCPVCSYAGDGTHEAGEPCGFCWQRCVEPVPTYRPRHFVALWQDAPAHEGSR